MTELIPPFVAGWLLTAALLVIFHLLFDDQVEEVRYILGAGAICTGCSLTGLLIDNPILTFGPWIVTSSGLVVIVMQWFERRARTRETNAQKSGEIVGIARGLTQEIIDRGNQEPRSRN